MPAPPSSRDLARETREEFFRSTGPGGQNVNKVETAVRLRFAVSSTTLLPEDVKVRLARLAGRRLSADGVLAIEARRFRTRERNREDALERLQALIARAWEPVAPRRPTRPSAGSRERRLESKIRRSTVKRGRSRIAPDGD